MRWLACRAPGNWPKAWITSRMQYSENHDTSSFDRVEDRKRKSRNDGSADLIVDGPEQLGILLDSPQGRLNGSEKLLAKLRSLELVPIECTSEVMLNTPAINDRQSHLPLRTSERISSSVRTSSGVR